MNSPDLLKSAKGEIGFAGFIRTPADYGIWVYQIKLPHRTLMYGEWAYAFFENGNDYNIYIVSFGYPNINSTSNGVYEMFDENEKRSIEGLIEDLFSNEDLWNKADGLSSTSEARFLGGITFASGWLVLRAEYEKNIRESMANLKRSTASNQSC